MQVRRLTIFLALVAIVLIAMPASLSAQEHEYIGTKGCKKCHIKEWKSWSLTSMANAFDLLKAGNAVEAKKAAGLDPQLDYTQDSECVACHVTGMGKPGGFVDIETTPELAGVGCEVCHGPGGTYTQEGHMTLANKEYKKADLVAVGLVANVSAKQCEGCHNPRSPFVIEGYKFDFDAMKHEGTHEHYPLKYTH